ncbi:MAG: hypothetical protein IKG86_02030 [Paludibacteraceae bacterium]|nr:hypothetical protein [Paludibacteraceae bacterium]
MKTIKSILIAATLICATAVSTMSAQQAAPAQKHEFKVAIGDSVMIKRECQKYLTGEKPSVWVWDKVHTVRQLGTKRFPDGVLLMNIYSWMCEDCLIPVNGRAQEAEEQAQEEQAEDKAAFEQAQREKALREAAEKAAAEAEATAEEQKAKEKAEKEEKAAAEKARKDSIKQEKADSIEAEKKFKHNYDRFTIGLRGGASALMHHAEKGNWTCGGDVVLDLQYAHYWTDDTRPVDLGLIVGLGIGYEQSGLKTNDSTAFTKANVNYTVVAKDIKETDHQLQLEVPLMFSLIHDNGLFFNVGPKFMIPLYTPYKQTVNTQDTHITAYFPETGITIQNNPVTGQYTGQQPTEKNGIQFNINVMLTAEIGYEWLLKSGNSIGLGAYANYSVFNTFKNTTNSEGLFNLTAPTDTDKAHLDVLSATHAYADKLGYFDAGIKLAYHFNFPKKQYKEYKANKLF